MEKEKTETMKLKSLSLMVLVTTILVLTPTLTVLAQTPNTAWISSGIQQPYSYVIWKQGSYYYAKNAYGFQPSWSGSISAITIVNNAITTSEDGDRIFLKNAEYNFGSNDLVLDPDKPSVVLEGESVIVDFTTGYVTGSILRFDTGYSLKVTASNPSGNLRFIFKNLGIVANTPRASGSLGILYKGGGAVPTLFENIVVASFETGVLFGNGTQALWSSWIGCTFLYNLVHVKMYSASGWEIDGNHFIGCSIIGRADLNTAIGVLMENDGEAGSYVDNNAFIGGLIQTFHTHVYIKTGNHFNSIIGTRCGEVIGSPVGDGIRVDAGAKFNVIKPSMANKLTINEPTTIVETVDYTTGSATIWGHRSGTAEASNDDWINFGVTFRDTPDVTLTVQESDANYVAQVKALNTTHLQLYLYDLTASALETVDKTICWYAEYAP